MVYTDQIIKKTIRVIESLEIIDGQYISGTGKVKINMVFKNITLFNYQNLKNVN